MRMCTLMCMARASQVLWPGLLGNSGPSCGEIGAAGHFRSAEAGPSPSASSDPAVRASFKGSCNDDVWPDGAGTFAWQGGSAFTVRAACVPAATPAQRAPRVH